MPSSHDEVFERITTPLRQLVSLERTRDLERIGEVIGDLVLGERVFERHHGPFVTIFGSARTDLEHPVARAAERLAARLRERGWMIVAGAGPGIMAAAAKGAGREGNIGVNIELPFEHGMNPWVDAEANHVATAHFFTRKVLLTRKAHAFVAFPGGVGTMDELFEVLTLLNTSKTPPAPVLLMDEPGGDFWVPWCRMMDRVVADGYLSAGDTAIYRLSDDVEDAVTHLDAFYRVFESAVVKAGSAQLRLRRPVSAETLATLRETLGDIDVRVGGLSNTLPHDGRLYARLVGAINVLNADEQPLS
jgi:uncharacterized protein (TIGR00730 family)